MKSDSKHFKIKYKHTKDRDVRHLQKHLEKDSVKEYVPTKD